MYDSLYLFKNQMSEDFIVKVIRSKQHKGSWILKHWGGGKSDKLTSLKKKSSLKEDDIK